MKTTPNPMAVGADKACSCQTKSRRHGLGIDISSKPQTRDGARLAQAKKSLRLAICLLKLAYSHEGVVLRKYGALVEDARLIKVTSSSDGISATRKCELSYFLGGAQSCAMGGVSENDPAPVVYLTCSGQVDAPRPTLFIDESCIITAWTVGLFKAMVDITVAWSIFNSSRSVHPPHMQVMQYSSFTKPKLEVMLTPSVGWICFLQSFAKSTFVPLPTNGNCYTTEARKPCYPITGYLGGQAGLGFTHLSMPFQIFPCTQLRPTPLKSGRLSLQVTIGMGTPLEMSPPDHESNF
ncbi:uncharacterized protein BDR25DRAFT_356436 [Lindgomyces ingoldianus]|uniref:Uncharacterized protein n=1 Tax=Lindgomyces ingoldianus TaxID=673940 RepID=A0ACB6QRT3_9PLEO|nr:uncharacterized protein BDR25DRAFT_356436 [Lindgomyces ingoldianus]KAF2469694.1 hypothetical protein BDR25DRAFT_356436 [Lindgomyces ingoldianus]